MFFKIKSTVSYENIPDKFNGTIQFYFQLLFHQDIIVLICILSTLLIIKR